MSSRTVHVAVRELFFRRIPYFDELDIKIQVLARQRMVAVDGDHVAGDGGYGDGARAFSASGHASAFRP